MSRSNAHSNNIRTLEQRYGKKNTHHDLKIVVHNRQNFGTRYTEHRDALADLEPELEFGRVAILEWLLNRNTSSSSSSSSLDRRRIEQTRRRRNYMMNRKQLSPQRIYFQELQKRRASWENDDDSSSSNSSSIMKSWRWVEDD